MAPSPHATLPHPRYPHTHDTLSFVDVRFMAYNKNPDNNTYIPTHPHTHTPPPPTLQVLQLREAVLRRHAVHIVSVDITGAGLDEAWTWLRGQVLGTPGG